MSQQGESRPRSWLARHWKWMVPVGCLGVLAGVIAFAFGIVTIVMGSMKSTWPYQEGVRLAASHPDVVDALGEPITTGRFLSGSISVTGSSGEADLAIPLRGPNGRGTLYVIAWKRAGEWSFELAEVAVKGRTGRIDLLSGDGRRVSGEANDDESEALYLGDPARQRLAYPARLMRSIGEP